MYVKCMLLYFIWFWYPVLNIFTQIILKKSGSFSLIHLYSQIFPTISFLLVSVKEISVVKMMSSSSYISSTKKPGNILSAFNSDCGLFKTDKFIKIKKGLITQYVIDDEAVIGKKTIIVF